MTNFAGKLPRRAILTEDPLRARMLVAHHLEYAEPVYENDDILMYSGSYNGTAIALISTGFGPVAPWLAEAGRLGVSELLYIGECVSQSHPLRTVVLADSGDDALLMRAKNEAARIDIPVIVQNVSSQRDAPQGSVFAPVATEMSEYARENGLALLSILTVTVDSRTGEEMEEHERRSRLYAASRLAFEVCNI